MKGVGFRVSLALNLSHFCSPVLVGLCGLRFFPPSRGHIWAFPKRGSVSSIPPTHHMGDLVDGCGPGKPETLDSEGLRVPSLRRARWPSWFRD